MKIRVCGQQEAEVICKKMNKADGDIQCAVISIVSPSDHEADIKVEGGIKKIFRMKFYDVLEDEYQERELPESERPARPLYPAARKEDMEGLKEFVDSLSDESINLLIVHCGAGMSRSAAVATAVKEYLGTKHDDIIHCARKMYPNRHVEEIAKEVLGIRKDEKDYYEIFAKQE